MKHFFVGSILATTLILAPCEAGAQCTHCVIQTKAPSASIPGKFEYRVSCIIDISGDEVNTAVVAANDEDAIEMVRQTRC